MVVPAGQCPCPQCPQFREPHSSQSGTKVSSSFLAPASLELHSAKADEGLGATWHDLILLESRNGRTHRQNSGTQLFCGGGRGCLFVLVFGFSFVLNRGLFKSPLTQKLWPRCLDCAGRRWITVLRKHNVQQGLSDILDDMQCCHGAVWPSEPGDSVLLTQF